MSTKFASKTQEQGNSVKSREIILQNTETTKAHGKKPDQRSRAKRSVGNSLEAIRNYP